MGRSIDDSFDVCINKFFGHFEFFTENVQLPVTANETNDDDVAIRYVGQLS